MASISALFCFSPALTDLIVLEIDDLVELFLGDSHKSDSAGQRRPFQMRTDVQTADADPRDPDPETISQHPLVDPALPFRLQSEPPFAENPEMHAGVKNARI